MYGPTPDYPMPDHDKRVVWGNPVKGQWHYDVNFNGEVWVETTHDFMPHVFVWCLPLGLTPILGEVEFRVPVTGDEYWLPKGEGWPAGWHTWTPDRSYFNPDVVDPCGHGWKRWCKVRPPSEAR